MLWHYFSTSIRSLHQNRLHSLISVMGLTLALVAVFLIGLYIKDELTHERWIPNYDKIYRVDPVDVGQGIRYDSAPSVLGRWIRQDFPELEGVTRAAITRRVVSYGESEYYEFITWADSNFFDVFDFKVNAGSLADAISQPNSVVITKRIADKYFQNESPIGKQLIVSNQDPMLVNAVIENPPSRTHLTLDILASSDSTPSFLASMDRNPLTGSFSDALWATQTYIKIDLTEHIDGLESRMAEMLDRRLPPDGANSTSNSFILDLLPIADIHLTRSNTEKQGKDLSQIFSLLSISALIIAGASINHVNLMTALGRKRAKEIAMRKTLGASSLNIFFQFLIESLLYVTVSCLVASVLTSLLVNPVSSLLGISLEFSLLTDSALIVGVLFLVAIVTVSAGLYPSLVVARYTAGPILSLSAFRHNTGALRYALVTCQFAILTGLVVAAFVMFGQAQFGIAESSTGDEDTIVNISTPCNTALKQSLNELEQVRGVSCSALIPQLGMNYDTSISRRDAQDQDLRILYTALDAEFFGLYGINTIAGRNFDESRTTDFSPLTNEWNTPEAIILNETAVRRLGFNSPESAVGSVLEWIRFFDAESLTDLHDVVIIGVVEDFQIGSVREGLQPAAFFADPAWSRQMSVKIRGSQVQETLEQIDTIWDSMDFNRPIARNFYATSIQAMYQATLREAKMSAAYSGIAMCIALLGLISLSVFESQRRTKEIGIRKVLGGSRLDITSMLLWEYSKPLLWSTLLAWPITYYVLSQWLQNYQRHIDLDMGVFAISTLLISFSSLLLVAVSALRTISENPVAALGSE